MEAGAGGRRAGGGEAGGQRRRRRSWPTQRETDGRKGGCRPEGRRGAHSYQWSLIRPILLCKRTLRACSPLSLSGSDGRGTICTQPCSSSHPGHFPACARRLRERPVRAARAACQSGHALRVCPPRPHVRLGSAAAAPCANGHRQSKAYHPAASPPSRRSHLAMPGTPRPVMRPALVSFAALPSSPTLRTVPA